MENQKRENLLNLALDTPEAERERSVKLSELVSKLTEQLKSM